MADKKRLIDYLQANSGTWCGLADIAKVVSDVSERTLRRWLAELTKQGKVQRSGEKKGTRYRWLQPASSNSPLPDSGQVDRIFNTSSEELLNRTTAPLYTRPPVTYSETWVASYRPNQTFYLSEPQRLSLRRLGKREGIQGRAGTYVEKIFRRMLIDLSYNSARLEGNTYTIADTEQLLLQGVSATGKLDEERIMILNHKEAIRYLVENVASLKLDEETIRTLHYLLADSLIAPGMAGQIRDEGIRVSGTTYVPLEGKGRLQRLLDEVLHKARAIEDCFEQSFFLLGHLAYLQAFVDVNKRTSRLASIIPLIINDYIPQSFIDVDKDDYLKAMICFYEFNEVGPLADLYTWSYRRSCQHYDTALQAVGFDEVAARYRHQRREQVAYIVRSKIPKAEVPALLRRHMPVEVQSAHQDKFIHDVLDELTYLDISRIAGLGITRKQLEAWLALPNPTTQTP